MLKRKKKIRKTARKGTLSYAKKKCWEAFALMKKLEYSEDGVNVRCYTCNAKLEIGTSNCQLGHCLPKGGYGALYFHENNVRPQCYRCNIHKAGDTAVFIMNLIEEIGQDAYEEMYKQRHDQMKITQKEYEEMTKKFTNRITKIKEQKWN